MATQEKTSPKIASDAARIVRMGDGQLIAFATRFPARLRSVAASALTQTPDRPDRERPE